MRHPHPTLALVLLGLGACAFRPPEISYDDEPIQATQIPEPPRPVEIVEEPTPLPLPGQLQRIPASRRTPEPPDPTVRVNLANAAARVQPVRAAFINAVQVYARLLEVFWRNVDPFDASGQFCESYATAIFVLDEAQRRAAGTAKAAIEARL